jgi:hypothetical protein
MVEPLSSTELYSPARLASVPLRALVALAAELAIRETHFAAAGDAAGLAEVKWSNASRVNPPVPLFAPLSFI